MVPVIRLSDYATTPLYNIKAVVQATAISPSTLRAWERRYNMCSPERSESGYRLYSDRDIAIIRWLKAQVDAGMSISQAVLWLQTLVRDAENAEMTSLPDPTGRAMEHATPVLPVRQDVQNFQALQLQLLNALLGYDEPKAEQVLARAFALYPVETVGEDVIMPVMVEIGERWHRGQLSVTREHYATNYLLQRLAALLRAVPNQHSGALLWIGCAPGELHELGAMLLAIYLRRAGFQVCYLGQDLPEEDLIREAQTVRPAMVLFSASSSGAARALAHLCELLAQLEPPRPIIGYGGRIFNTHPALRDTIAGVFLGATALEAVESVTELLTDHGRVSRRSELRS